MMFMLFVASDVGDSMQNSRESQRTPGCIDARHFHEP
jgi:hypothetical protein